jgi:hypothetical protein
MGTLWCVMGTYNLTHSETFVLVSVALDGPPVIAT